jgi:hypothetical protein
MVKPSTKRIAKTSKIVPTKRESRLIAMFRKVDPDSRKAIQALAKLAQTQPIDSSTAKAHGGQPQQEQQRDNEILHASLDLSRVSLQLQSVKRMAVEIDEVAGAGEHELFTAAIDALCDDALKFLDGAMSRMERARHEKQEASRSCL